MARFINFLTEYIGLAPDSITLIGDQKAESVLIRLIDFNLETLVESTLTSLKDIHSYDNKNTKTWINIDGLHDKQVMQDITKELGINPILISDVLNTGQRAKLQSYDNFNFISLKMLRLDEEEEEVISENLGIVFIDSLLITFQERKGDVFEPIRNRIRNSKRLMRESKLDYLIIALIDVIVDNYSLVLSKLGEKIEELENESLIDMDRNVIVRINEYKNELLFINKSIKPLYDVLEKLSSKELELVGNENQKFIQSVISNLTQTIDALESYKELLANQLNLYHSTMSAKLNEIMKFLTIFSVIFIPLTFIAGIYGTNFEYLPELKYKYSYFYMLGFMLVLALFMIYYFKRKKWF